MLYEILHRITGEMLYSHGGSLKEAVEKAAASGANLRGADLRGANLRDANLSHIRNDLWAVLLYAPNEVPALIAALDAGRVNGSVYRDNCHPMPETPRETGKTFCEAICNAILRLSEKGPTDA